MVEGDEEKLQRSLKAVNARFNQRVMVLDPSKIPLDPGGTHCNFCGKGPEEYEHIIRGPSVRICGECVEVCVDVLKEMREE